MFKPKNSLIAVAGLSLVIGLIALIGPTRTQGQGGGNSPARPRRYYLTTTQHDGNESLTACAAGYHMASLWEIHDPTNLRYDTQLGFTTADSGFGPPIAVGVVRTGADADGFFELRNCKAWTSDSVSELGTLVSLAPGSWNSDASRVSPW